MLRSEYRKGKRHARISSCSKKDMDYHVEYPSVEKVPHRPADLLSRPETTIPTNYCPPPFRASREEQDLFVNTTSSQDIPNEQSSSSVRQCTINLTLYSTPKMTAMDEELEDVNQRKPAETTAFALLQPSCIEPANTTVPHAQDDEHRTVSTPQMSFDVAETPNRWPPFPQQFIHPEAEHVRDPGHSTQDELQDGQEVSSLELYEGEVRLSYDSHKPKLGSPNRSVQW